MTHSIRAFVSVAYITVCWLQRIIHYEGANIFDFHTNNNVSTLCACVCVCVFERDRERDKEREGKRMFSGIAGQSKRYKIKKN